MGAMLSVLQQRRVPLWTSAGVLAQVWRDGRRQALLASVLAGVGVRPLATEDARAAGELLRAAKTEDVIDAHVALAVAPADRVLTSDPQDLGHLLSVRRVKATVVKV